MSEVLHANIFFFIASVGVVAFIILTSVILYHVLKVVRAIRRIVERIEVGSEQVAEDLGELRSMMKPSRLFSLLMNITGMGSGSTRRRSKDHSDEDE